MPRNIERDYKHFIDVISGKLRKELRKYTKTGKIFPLRTNGKNQLPIPLPRIENPFFVHGEQDHGLRRGPGKPGDVIGRVPGQGEGGGGNSAEEGMMVNVDLEDVLLFLQDELKLPDLKPKPNEIFEEIEIKYNNISLVGPESLRHNRRTMLEALKRQAAAGNLDKLYYIPGQKDPVKLIVPINSDKRFRQFKEIKHPSSNAVIFFARDGSGSMEAEHCDIVNDMCWWIDVWIRRFYKKVERCYFWHDGDCDEVDEKTFYAKRMGGGTIISSCFRKMAEQFETRFPLDRWNVYVFYFTDGENWEDDNPRVAPLIQEHFGPQAVNLLAITQVLCRDYGDSFKKFVEESVVAPNLRTVSIGPEESSDFGGVSGAVHLTEDERGEAIKHAIRTILGNKSTADVSI